MNKFKKSFTARLITLVLLPVLVASVALTIISATKLSDSMNKSTIEKLQGATRAFKAVFEQLATEQFSIDENGVMYADGKDLSYFLH